MTEVEKRSVAEINQGMTFEPSTASQPDRAALLLRLDELLETYLNTLDQYQKAQQQLATRLSSGYFSLAQANFNNQSRTRYGQDYYDERMQALRKINITVEGNNITFAASPLKSAPQDASPAQASAESSGELSKDSSAEAVNPSDEAEIRWKDSTEGTQSADLPEATEAKEAAETKEAPATESKEPRNPLRWFGILVPPALRSAQSSFLSAIEGPVPELATIITDLRRQEIEIGRLRKQIRKS